MASGMTAAKRFVVRTSLVTGSTLALVMGAQALVTVDVQNAPVVQSSTTQIADTISTTTSVAAPTAAQTIIHAAPNIVILRHPSQANTLTANNTVQQAAPNNVVQLPRPVAVQPPAPIIVQSQPQVVAQASGPSNNQPAPSVPTTRSTR